MGYVYIPHGTGGGPCLRFSEPPLTADLNLALGASGVIPEIHVYQDRLDVWISPHWRKGFPYLDSFGIGSWFGATPDFLRSVADYFERHGPEIYSAFQMLVGNGSKPREFSLTVETGHQTEPRGLPAKTDK